MQVICMPTGKVQTAPNTLFRCTIGTRANYPSVPFCLHMPQPPLFVFKTSVRERGSESGQLLGWSSGARPNWKEEQHGGGRWLSWPSFFLLFFPLSGSHQKPLSGTISQVRNRYRGPSVSEKIVIEHHQPVRNRYRGPSVGNERPHSFKKLLVDTCP